MERLRSLRRAIYPITSRYLSRAIHVGGTLKGTNLSLRCLFFCNSLFAEYAISRFFEGAPSFRRSWRCWKLALRDPRRACPPGIDLCIAELPLEYEASLHGKYDFKCQPLVRQRIDTAGSREQITQRFSRRRKEIARKLASDPRLSYRISSEPADFDLFYHRMHAPFVARRFGDTANLDSYEELKQYFRRSFLLFVMQDGRAVAGALCRPAGDHLIFYRLGVLDGDSAHVRSGAQTCLYYFLMKLAQERKFKALDVTKSRPVLTDGVYLNKRDWGATVSPDDEATTWVYFFNVSRAPQVARLFELHPVIIHTRSGLRALTGGPSLDPSAALSPEVAAELAHRCRSPGLRGVTVMMSNGELRELAGPP